MVHARIVFYGEEAPSMEKECHRRRRDDQAQIRSTFKYIGGAEGRCGRASQLPDLLGVDGVAAAIQHGRELERVHVRHGRRSGQLRAEPCVRPGHVWLHVSRQLHPTQWMRQLVYLPVHD